jgi:DNA primase
MGILDEDVRRVREATDLVELAREHVALRRVGRRWSGLCPFHNEKSPSFTINQELGAYYCFGCQARGDAISFVREVEHLDFVGAVERLAARAGIQLRYDNANATAERQRRQRLHEAVDVAIAFYHQRMLSGDDAGVARRYIRGRGFDGDAVRRFQLGYSPDGWDTLSRHLLAQKFSRDDLVTANLAYVNRANKLQDVFRNRLMFPIRDARGDAVGFGARTLTGDDGPKYKNTAETPIYRKSSLLYGLNWAKGEIVARQEIVICEGYTDVMAFHLAGVTQAVATCGTALADDHFVQLKNLARRITLAYDSDAAGLAAADRCYQWEQRFEVQFQVADLPAGRDPGDLWPDDVDRITKSVEAAVPFLQFRIDRAIQAAAAQTIEDRSRVANDCVVMIAEHPNDFVRDEYVMRVASALGITNVQRIRDEVARVRAGGTASLGRQQGQPRRRDERPDARRELVALRWIVQAPELVAAHVDIALFADQRLQHAFEMLLGAESFDEAIASADDDTAALLQRLAVEDTVAGTDDAPAMALRVVTNLIEASSQRLLTSMLAAADVRSVELKRSIDALVAARDAGKWEDAVGIADELVAWLHVTDAAAEADDGHD